MERFRKFFDTYGLGTPHGAIDAGTLERYREALGADIYEFLAHEGVSRYMDGFLWTLDPAQHVRWLTEWIGADTPCIPFARTAFADLLFVVDRRIVVLLSNKGLLSRLTDRGDRKSVV